MKFDAWFGSLFYRELLPADAGMLGLVISEVVEFIEEDDEHEDEEDMGKDEKEEAKRRRRCRTSGLPDFFLKVS